MDAPLDSGDEAANYGRHGDIKPKNILWFSRYGERKDHMVISDLGLTRYHSKFTRSKVTPSNVDGFTEAYRPPEMDIPGRQICRKFDIWSLGCVFLEFCVWYLEGADGIDKFEYARQDEDISSIQNFREPKFFNIMEKDDEGNTIPPRAEVKHSVTKVGPILLVRSLTQKKTPFLEAPHQPSY